MDKNEGSVKTPCTGMHKSLHLKASASFQSVAVDVVVRRVVDAQVSFLSE